MIEFALLAPMLFLILFGIVDFGRAIFYANEITNASREGARIAILASNPCNTQIGNPTPGNCSTSLGTGVDVCTAIKQEANLIPSSGPNDWTCAENSAAVPPTTPGANNAYVQIDSLSSCTAASTTATRATPRVAGNKAIKVTIVYYFRPLTGLVAVFFPTNYYLSSSTCARQEW
jgi:Flp pilus assembly protein TadG